MRSLTCLCALWSLSLLSLTAQPVSTQIDAENSVISYTGSAVLHDFTGVSHRVSGPLVVDLAQPQNSRIEIIVPIESFDSGNGNRDSNMLDAVDVDYYPDVHFVSTTIAPGAAGTWNVQGNLTFHGKTRPVQVPVQVTSDGGVFEGQGTFDVALSDYKVKRPRLMMVPIDDVIHIAFTVRAPLSPSVTR
ncbi:MAG TPA: YceI family protein [Rhodothermales bacterium]|nr:YceI family protein [Rhodothermales bacterium]